MSDFMLHPSWYYALRHVPAWQRYLLVFMVQVLLVAAWFMLLQPWFEHTMLQEQQKRQQTVLEHASYEKTEQELKDLRQQKNSLERELHAFVQTTSTNDRMQQLMHNLEQHGLVVQAIAKHDVQEHEWYSMLQITVDAQGTLEQILQLLRNLKERTDLMDISAITMQYTQNGVYTLHLRLMLYQVKESPSTLKKAEGLGG
jgi:Tfp pilus assembly protein PilO